MGNNQVVGTIHSLSDATFEWRLPNSDKLVKDGFRWRNSPPFNFGGSSWCLQVNPYHEAHFISFCLHWNGKGVEYVVQNYTVFIKDKVTLFWESPVVLDSFDEDCPKGMLMCHKKEFISNVVEKSGGYLSFAIKFNSGYPPKFSSMLRARLGLFFSEPSHEQKTKNADLKEEAKRPKERYNSTRKEEILNRWEIDLNGREEDLNGREEDLNRREEDLNRREDALFRRELDLNSRGDDMSEKEESLNKRMQDLIKNSDDLKAKAIEMGEMGALLEKLNQMSMDYENFLATGEGSDLVLEVAAGQKLPVHKAFLMARSKVFCRMLQHDMLEAREGVIRIQNCDPEVAKMFLLYLYCGRFPEVTEWNVVKLHGIAHMYDLPMLVSHCRSKMVEYLSRDNFCEIFTVAVHHVDDLLTSGCKRFFRENLKQIIETGKWETFLEENPRVGNALIKECL